MHEQFQIFVNSKFKRDVTYPEYCVDFAEFKEVPRDSKLSRPYRYTFSSKKSAYKFANIPNWPKFGMLLAELRWEDYLHNGLLGGPQQSVQACGNEGKEYCRPC